MRKNKIILAALAGFGLAVAFGLLVACQNQAATTTNDTSAQNAQGAPAVAGSAWFIRTEKSLYRVEKRD